MARSRLVFFRIGCWASIVTAVLHLIGQISGPQPPANDTERVLNDLMTSYQFELPGGGRRALMEFMNGFSLQFALFVAFMGGLGLIIAKRGRDDVLLMTAVTRTYAAVALVLLVISLTHWFIVPTVCIGVMAFFFGVSVVGVKT